MTQIIKKVMEMKSPKIEQVEVQTSIESEVDELLGDLNPRYFEETYSLKEAKIRAEASSVSLGFINGFFGSF